MTWFGRYVENKLAETKTQKIGNQPEITHPYTLPMLLADPSDPIAVSGSGGLEALENAFPHHVHERL